MIALAYLAALLAVIGCMALLDHRFRLVLWADARRGALTLVGRGPPALAAAFAGALPVQD